MPVRHTHDSYRSIGPGETLPGFPDRFPLEGFQALQADRLQPLLLRLPRRSAGSTPTLARPGRHSATVRVSSELLFTNASQVVTCAGPARARRGEEMRDASIRTASCVAVVGGRIAAVGPRAGLRLE